MPIIIASHITVAGVLHNIARILLDVLAQSHTARLRQHRASGSAHRSRPDLPGARGKKRAHFLRRQHAPDLLKRHLLHQRRHTGQRRGGC